MGRITFETDPAEIGRRRDEAAAKWADENSIGTIDKFERIEAFKAGSVYQVYETTPAYEIYKNGWEACAKERDVFYSNLQQVLAGYRQAAQGIVTGNAPGDLPMLQDAKYSWACELLKDALANDKRWELGPDTPLLCTLAGNVNTKEV